MKTGSWFFRVGIKDYSTVGKGEDIEETTAGKTRAATKLVINGRR